MKKLLSILIFKGPSAKRLVIGLWGGLCTVFIGVIILNLWVDPYFVFRSSPFQSHMHFIDIRQRFAKSLQVITRQPHTIILGSSRVYRGFEVEDGLYNMGVSSLTLTEAAKYVDHSLHFTEVRQIVLGLDFWMCDKNRLTEVDWDEKIGTFPYLFQSFFNILIQPNDALSVLKERLKTAFTNDLLGIKAGWTYEGFYRTDKGSREAINHMLEAYKASFEKSHIDLKLLSQLEHIIEKCKSRGVKLYVYISPLHPVTKRIYLQSKNAVYFAPWRENIRQICENQNVPFQDLTDLLKDSPALSEGSTEDWLDYSHFSPQIGRRILQLFKIL